MMTREEFLNELEYADDVLYPGKFSPYARNIAAHDQAQRAVIEQQAKEIENLKSEMRHWTLERFNQLGQENQALREALQVWQSLFRQAVSVANGLTNYVGDRPGLHDAERSLERLEQQAQQALKEVS